mgnify:CR=1 FL=1
MFLTLTQLCINDMRTYSIEYVLSLYPPEVTKFVISIYYSEV